MPEASAPGRRWSAPTGDQVRIAGLVAIVAGLSVFTTAFMTVSNLLDLISSLAVIGILAAGLLVVLIAGEIDISFSAVMTVAQYLAAWVTIKYGGNWFTMFAIAILVAVVLELANALLVQYLRAMSIIVTIATFNLYFGVVNFASGGEWLYNFPDWFTASVGFDVPLPGGGHATITMTILALALFWGLIGLMLTRLTIAQRLYAVGGSRESAHHSGLSVSGTRLFAFGTLGVAAGIAAVVHAQLVQTVSPNALAGTELEVLTAVVLGGTSLNGGVGTFRGMVCGVAFIALIKNGLTLLRIDSYYHTFLLGLLILGSITASSFGNRVRDREVVA